MHKTGADIKVGDAISNPEWGEVFVVFFKSEKDHELAMYNSERKVYLIKYRDDWEFEVFKENAEINSMIPKQVEVTGVNIFWSPKGGENA